MTTRLTVATDGSCLGNPGPGGWSWVIDENAWQAGGHPRTTNNLMELRAVYELLAHCPRDVPLHIQIDSQYVMNIFTEWIEKWRANGWKTASNKSVANRVAVEQTAALLAGRDVTWEHVRGHVGHRLNELADSRATAAAACIRDARPVSSGPYVDLRRVWEHL